MKKQTQVKKIKKPKKSRIYMGPDVDAAIVEYNCAVDQTLKNKIYNERIKYAFEKLAENVLNNWKFPYVTDSFKNKKAELISHFILNLHLYSPEKGSAFSYFTFAGRNYFIIHNEGSYNKLKQEIRIDMDDRDEPSSLLQLRDENVEKENLQDDKKELIALVAEYFDKNIPKIFKKKPDILIAYSVLQLIQSYEDIENFNKKNIYILIREMTNSRAQNITKVLNKMRDIYKHLISQYIDEGDISMEYGTLKNSNAFFK